MSQERSESTWKSYLSGIMLRNFTSLRKIDKYFRMNISDSMSKAIEENWLRILGMDYEIISFNLYKNNEPLGIALQGRNVFSHDGQEMIPRHYLKAIIPHFSLGSSNKLLIGDELLEVNGLKIYGMSNNEVIRALKKLPNYIQFVVARPIHSNNEYGSEYDGSADFQLPLSFYEMDDDLSSHTSTMKSNSSIFSSTSRDYGSTTSVTGLNDGRCSNVTDYLSPIIGWRGPIVIEFRKRNKESLGLALQEIKDPKSSQLIIVFKIIVPEMKAAKDGRLHVGDRLLQVNGKLVSGVGFRKVCQWMKSAPGGRLVLYVCKPHFPVCNSENDDFFPDNYLYHTLTDTDKLPKLQEENCEQILEMPPVSESLVDFLFLKGNNERLGIFLDIADNGINGCRLKKIARGLVRNDGRLHEGDYITMINETSLKVSEKNQLDNCLRSIVQCKGDYKISFIKKSVIDLHKIKYSRINGDQSPEGDVDITLSLPMLDNLDQADLGIDLSNEFSILADLPDMYFCTLLKSQAGFGFSVLGLMPGQGVFVSDISPNSPASETGVMKSGHKILLINNNHVSTSSVENVIKLVKNSQHSIGLLMETPKFREFEVHVVKDSSNSFGLNIAGGIDTVSPFAIIESVVPNTSCQYSEQLQPHDIIVKANEIFMLNLDHEDIIKTLRSLPQDSNLKIWRQLPFWNREFLDEVNSSSVMISQTQFSVTINKPVSSIPSFGITFNDILILDQSDMEVKRRYKSVISVERNSLCEQYVPEVIQYCYLMAINGEMVDCEVSCEDLKRQIDSQNQVELLLCRDIPYTECCANTERKSDNFSRTNSIGSVHSANGDALSESTSLIVPCESTKVSAIEANIEAPFVNERSSTQSDDTAVLTDNEIYDRTDCDVDKNFEIAIETVTVPISESIELGFRVIGGVDGGPNGETLPVIVVAVQRNTCNWPKDREQPWLQNGSQLLELNGTNLALMDAGAINRILCSTVEDLTLKVVKFSA